MADDRNSMEGSIEIQWMTIEIQWKLIEIQWKLIEIQWKLIEIQCQGRRANRREI